MDGKDKALAFKNKGNEFFKNKQYNKAIENYTQAINLNSMDATYYTNRAACYFYLKEYEKCIHDCNDALALDPKSTKAWIRKGRSLLYLGRNEEAQEALQKAKDVDVSDRNVRQEVNDLTQVITNYVNADAALKSSNFKEAVDLLKKVLVSCADFGLAKIKAIEALSKSGDTKTAVELVNRYSGEFTNNVEFLYVKGLALCYHGQTDAGKRAWVEASRIEPDNVKCREAVKTINRMEEAKEKGNADFKAGKNQSAIDHYSTGIKLVLKIKL